MPLRFLCELKKFASVSSHVSSHMAILLRNFCMILLFAFMAWFEISNEIERRFYQEALSPDLKWRKQGLASLGRCCLMENAISPPNCEVFKEPLSPRILRAPWGGKHNTTQHSLLAERGRRGKKQRRTSIAGKGNENDGKERK